MTKSVRIVLLAGAVMYAASCAAESTDAEIRERIVLYHTPRCGGEPGSRRRPALIEVLDIGGDTNRLARILEELAQTNDNWNARMALHDLRIYGTPAELPFLYSYATNAQCGACAMESIFAIEGVNTNSVSAMRGYLSLTNALTNGQSHDRSVLCKDLLDRVYSSPELAAFRQDCLDMMIDFAQYRNSGHVSLDGSIQSVDPTYHASKRRLAVLRAAQNRCGNSFQLDYVTNAINELVAYPEANLPD